MYQTIPIEKFLENRSGATIIDVRSPSEFRKGHIQKAVSLPLFSDSERAMIGTDYVKANREKAIFHALELIAPKIVSFGKAAKTLAKNKPLFVYCWRGGMRSNSMAWLFDMVGIQTFVLEGGYKSYRRHIHESFVKQANILVLGGMTGSGKTDLLLEMQRQGEQVIDLERLANHKGSTFGAIDMPPQPNTEQFENELFERWNQLDFTKPIWLEDESKSIGKVVLPDPIFNKIRNSKTIVIQIDRQKRIEKLEREYISENTNIAELKLLIEKLEKKLGGDNTQKCLQAIDNKDFKTAIEIVLHYYDKAYQFSITERKSEVYYLDLEADNIAINVLKIIQFTKR